MSDDDQITSTPNGNSTSRLDFKRIEFPTDRLTVRQIRELEADVDAESPQFHVSESQNARGTRVPSVCWVMGWERTVALLTFEIALGSGERFKESQKPDTLDGYNPPKADQHLVDAYMTYGMAQTSTEARQMIRSVKEQVHNLALEAQGKDPSTGRKR